MQTHKDGCHSYNIDGTVISRDLVFCLMLSFLVG